MTIENIIRRIQGCFRLAEGTNSEKEAQAAIHMAHSLLRQHNLDMSEVTAKEEISAMVTETTDVFTRTYEWVWCIAIAVSCLCHVKYFREGSGWQWRMCFCGTQTDVAAAQMMFRYLYQTIQNLGNKHKVPGWTMRDRNSFCNGVGWRIAQRAEAIKAAEEAEQTLENSSTALMVLKDQELAKYMERHPVESAKVNTTNGNASAWGMGASVGNSVSLALPSEVLE